MLAVQANARFQTLFSAISLGRFVSERQNHYAVRRTRFGRHVAVHSLCAVLKQQVRNQWFSCPAELVRILQTCPGIDHVFMPGTLLPPFDVQLPLMSLPAVMKTTLATVPAAVPYLFADITQVEHWRQKLCGEREAGSGEREAGSGGRHKGTTTQHAVPIMLFQDRHCLARKSQVFAAECRAADKKRSMALAQFSHWLACRGYGCSVCKRVTGPTVGRLSNAMGKIAVYLSDKLTDFMDTAAVMMNLDLIVSVDTAPLHLAGALGLPVWWLLRYAGCWRWLLDRER